MTPKERVMNPMSFASDQAPAELLSEALDALCRLEASSHQALSAIAWITWRGRSGSNWSLSPKSGSDGVVWATLVFMAQASADELIGPLELEWGPMSQREYAERLRRESGGIANLCAEVPLGPQLEWFGSCAPDQKARRSEVVAHLSHFIGAHALQLLPEPAARIREPLSCFIERLGRHARAPSPQTQQMLRDAFLPAIEQRVIQQAARSSPGGPCRTPRI